MRPQLGATRGGEHEGVGDTTRLEAARDGGVEVAVEHGAREALLELRRSGHRGHVRRRRSESAGGRSRISLGLGGRIGFGLGRGLGGRLGRLCGVRGVPLVLRDRQLREDGRRVIVLAAAVHAGRRRGRRLGDVHGCSGLGRRNGGLLGESEVLQQQ